MAIRFAQCRGNAVNVGGSGGGETYNTTWQHYWCAMAAEFSNGTGTTDTPDGWGTFNGRLNSTGDLASFQDFIHPSYDGGDFTFTVGLVLPTIAFLKNYELEASSDIDRQNVALGTITPATAMAYPIGPANFQYQTQTVTYTPSTSGGALPHYFRVLVERTDSENGNLGVVFASVEYGLS